MISTLEIKNFKSIKHLTLDCRRVNIFIGKPNTGKSNILESLGVFSSPYERLSAFVRFENMANLFYDQDINNTIEIDADNANYSIQFESGEFVGKGGDKDQKGFSFGFRCDYDGSWQATVNKTSPFKFYKFSPIANFPKQDFNFLLPPSGENLLAILLTNKDLRKLASDLFREFGTRIVLKPHENKIDIQKEIEDIIISYPYSVVSDTLRKIVFYLVAIETNKDSVIILEEPEAHSFPFYTKYLAERIALDETNQFFISTHNPYFLLSVLEKTPAKDMAIFITYFEDYQTKVKRLSEPEMSEFFDLDASVFFNLDHFLGEE